MTKQEALKMIKETNTTGLWGFLIHGKASKQIKELIKQELIKRGSYIEEN
jgi:hypothetical protein